MRTAVVTTSFPAFDGDPSGHFVLAEVRRIGGQVVVIAPMGATATPTSTSTSGLVVPRLPSGNAFGWPGAPSRLREHPHRLVDAALWMRRARRALDEHGPFDRIVAHWAIPCAWPIARQRGPLEVVSHGGDVRLLCRLPLPLRVLVVRRIATAGADWRFVSQPLLDALSARLPMPDAERLRSVARITPAAIELSDVRRAASERRARHAGTRLFVCAARLVRAKRIDRIIEHVARLPAMPDPPRLVVVGDGPERASLEHLARARRVDARFVGMTVREDALAWIAAADAILHASHEEGLSTVVREAQALGVTVERVG